MDFIELCGSKGIKREYINARTLQQNGVAERKNTDHYDGGRTMLADSFLPNTFWAEAVSTACYVLNRACYEHPTGDLSWPPSTTLLTTLIPLVPREDPPQLAHVLNLLISSSSIEADRLLAERVQEAEREQFTVEERAKFLHDTIATQRRILAQQRTEAIRNKPPTKNQFRNQMMTYLKHVGNKKHADLKTKSFDEIKALYEKVKRFDDSFITIGSTEDERKIKEMNEGASDPDKKKKFVKEDVSTKVPAKQDEAKQGTKKRKGGHMKMLARKRKRPQPDVDSDDEHRKCLKIVTFEGTIDSEIMERKSVIARLNKVSSPDGDYLVIYRANGNFRAFNYLLEGDLKIMMESSTEENDQSDFWNNQQNWEIVRWRLYEACGVYILELEDGQCNHS
ncbi:ribonuclease H-like domain-containing protein [Tanacetum coccineum]|uniref:Ribonuclease H-like domain-containing protein n=1 Tax=Tanacetum coccineum TaxID=301880 RepID=A0ABQ5GD78_9ASTR